MLQKFLTSWGEHPHWLSRNSKGRRRIAPPARPPSVNSTSPQMRTPCGCWLACRPIVRRSAQLAIGSCATPARRHDLSGHRISSAGQPWPDEWVSLIYFPDKADGKATVSKFTGTRAVAAGTARRKINNWLRNRNGKRNSRNVPPGR